MAKAFTLEGALGKFDNQRMIFGADQAIKYHIKGGIWGLGSKQDLIAVGSNRVTIIKQNWLETKAKITLSDMTTRTLKKKRIAEENLLINHNTFYTSLQIYRDGLLLATSQLEGNRNIITIEDESQEELCLAIFAMLDQRRSNIWLFLLIVVLLIIF